MRTGEFVYVPHIPWEDVLATQDHLFYIHMWYILIHLILIGGLFWGMCSGFFLSLSPFKYGRYGLKKQILSDTQNVFWYVTIMCMLSIGVFIYQTHAHPHGNGLRIQKETIEEFLFYVVAFSTIAFLYACSLTYAIRKLLNPSCVLYDPALKNKQKSK